MDIKRIKTAGRNAALQAGRLVGRYWSYPYDHHAMWLAARRQGATYGEALRIANALYSDKKLEVVFWEDF